MDMVRIEHDVLVIGAGGAGLSAAIAAAADGRTGRNGVRSHSWARRTR